MDVRLTDHAREQLGERHITREMVVAVLAQPDRNDADAWVNMAYRVIDGREICVLTAKRVTKLHLVVTLYDTAER